MNREHELLSVEEAADYLGVKKSTIYGWIFRRKVPFVKVGRLVKFRGEALRKWLTDREVKPFDPRKR